MPYNQHDMALKLIKVISNFGHEIGLLCEEWGVEPDVISEHGGWRGEPHLHLFSTAQRLAQHVLDCDQSVDSDETVGDKGQASSAL